MSARGYYILGADNQIIAVDAMTWAKWFENMPNRTVGYTQITSEILVSTVFLGLDHRFSGRRPAILFETVVFGGPRDGDMWRYSSWDDAEAGHAAAVRNVRAAIGQKSR
jgi:hypothetical protein